MTRSSSLRRPDQLEESQHEQRNRAERDEQNDALFVQHPRSTARLSVIERYAASTTARSRRPDGPSVSGGFPPRIASRNTASIISWPRRSRRKNLSRVRPAPRIATKRPRLS